jgi:formate dehydrogenase maturation protein FdhE
MTTEDWAQLILTILSIFTIVGVGVRWIIKKYVEDIIYEMKPNNGSSMKDQITRLEKKSEKIFDLMIEHLKDHSK